MPRFTIRRAMLEVAFAAALLAPAGWAAQYPSGAERREVAWGLAAGWAGLLLVVRWAYRDFRSPFG